MPSFFMIEDNEVWALFAQDPDSSLNNSGYVPNILMANDEELSTISNGLDDICVEELSEGKP